MTSSDHHAPPLVPRPWADRSNTLGILPGKSAGQLDALRRVTLQLPAVRDSQLTVQAADGTLREVLTDRLASSQLSRGGFAHRLGDVWSMTEQVEYWLATGDDTYLALYIQGQVKFFAELLQHVKNGAKTQDLLRSAAKYGLFWTSPDQVHRRTAWLQSLGMVERWGLAQLVVTDAGHEFLVRAEPLSPDSVKGSTASPDPEPPELPELSTFARGEMERLDQSALAARKILIGYIPRGKKTGSKGAEPSQGIIDATRTFVDLFDERTSTDELFHRSTEILSLKRTSFSQSMHTFRHMGLVEPVAMNSFGPTVAAKQVLNPGNEIDLITFLHARYRYFGEILKDAVSTTAVPELSRLARTRFGCDQIDTNEVRTRVQFLTDAGLLERIDWTRYVTTPLGRLVEALLPLEVALDPNADHTDEEVLGTNGNMSASTRASAVIRSELTRCAKLDGASSTDFELAVRSAFEALGFRAEHIGGSGSTDVLVTADLVGGERYCSIVDAKASAAGVVGDNAIKFDALKEHQKKHNADYGVVVGPDFSARVRAWAVANKFVLLTAEELASLVERQEASALTLTRLRTLFDSSTFDLDELDDAFAIAHHNGELSAKILSLLLEEAVDEDPLAGGRINIENLQYTLRKELSPRPTREDIELSLALLSSPLVGAVENKDGLIQLGDSPANVAARLRALADVVGAIRTIDLSLSDS